MAFPRTDEAAPGPRRFAGTTPAVVLAIAVLLLGTPAMAQADCRGPSEDQTGWLLGAPIMAAFFTGMGITLGFWLGAEAEEPCVTREGGACTAANPAADDPTDLLAAMTLIQAGLLAVTAAIFIPTVCTDANDQTSAHDSPGRPAQADLSQPELEWSPVHLRLRF